jgi:hypothetical protein
MLTALFALVCFLNSLSCTFAQGAHDPPASRIIDVYHLQ